MNPAKVERMEEDEGFEEALPIVVQMLEQLGVGQDSDAPREKEEQESAILQVLHQWHKGELSPTIALQAVIQVLDAERCLSYMFEVSRVWGIEEQLLQFISGTSSSPATEKIKPQKKASAPKKNVKKKDKPTAVKKAITKDRLRRPPNRWTEEEEKKLKKLVQKYPQNRRWVQISKIIGTKSASSCAQHWRRVLRPDINKGPWTKDEHNQLRMLVQRIGKRNWVEIASLIPGRSDIQCRAEYQKLLRAMVAARL
ncbi:Transcriptional activator Myb [Balamuthia mandrillaris]